MYVTEEYEFQVVAGKGTSTAQSIAEHASRIAEQFYGDLPFDLVIGVTGKAGQWTLSCVARANIRVEDE